MVSIDTTLTLPDTISSRARRVSGRFRRISGRVRGVFNGVLGVPSLVYGLSRSIRWVFISFQVGTEGHFFSIISLLIRPLSH